MLVIIPASGGEFPLYRFRWGVPSVPLQVGSSLCTASGGECPLYRFRWGVPSVPLQVGSALCTASGGECPLYRFRWGVPSVPLQVGSALCTASGGECPLYRFRWGVPSVKSPLFGQSPLDLSFQRSQGFTRGSQPEATGTLREQRDINHGPQMQDL